MGPEMIVKSGQFAISTGSDGLTAAPGAPCPDVRQGKGQARVSSTPAVLGDQALGSGQQLSALEAALVHVGHPLVVHIA